jgi:uncharacterized membrane protein affecting hemolysin expression
MNFELRIALVGFVAGVLISLILRQLRRSRSRSAPLNAQAKARTRRYDSRLQRRSRLP